MMITSKSLTTALAAASLVGVIGLAYAQSSDEMPQQSTAEPMTPVDPALQPLREPEPAPAPVIEETMTERAPQADRN